jgi:hypothetical protein
MGTEGHFNKGVKWGAPSRQKDQNTIKTYCKMKKVPVTHVRANKEKSSNT